MPDTDLLELFKEVLLKQGYTPDWSTRLAAKLVAAVENREWEKVGADG